MSYVDRKKFYGQIENLRKRPLISYVTSIRPNMGGNMAGDSISSIIELVDLIPKDKKEIDLLIISNGGDPITSLRIISLLRERFEKISVLLPYVAYSAATILALGADEIIMHPYSNLGPIDPQLIVSKQNFQGQPQQMHFSSEDLRNYIDFLKSDVNLTDQSQLNSALMPLISEVGALSIGNAKRSQQLSLALSEKMLTTHMVDKGKATTIAKALNSSYYHHGYAVSRKEAEDLGLNIIRPEQKLEKLLWNIWKDFSNEMKCDVTFDIMQELMSNPTIYAQINNVPTVNIPVNTPPQIIQQIWAQVTQNITVSTQAATTLQLLIAAIESTRHVKSVYNDVEVLYWRAQDMSLQFNATIHSKGWQ